ncbi:MAG: hypothetical protein HFE63_04725 [Clostridiales bacterium]|nr:hypothetical protein [Clostridiales bacterium]
MYKAKRKIALLLCVALQASLLAACGNDAKDPSDEDMTDSADNSSEAVDYGPLSGLDFDGESIRVLVSANEYDGGSGGKIFIMNSDTETGEIVSDAVYNRNKQVEEALNVKFEFTENTDVYSEISDVLSTLILSGEDLYDYVIHDLFPLASMSVNGYFANLYDAKYFDFDQDYWYSDYMEDLNFHSDKYCYIMAGDYFLDIIRTAHCLLFNQGIFEDLYGDSNQLYNDVFDNSWTMDKYLTYASGAYSDLNGDSIADVDDRYGMVTYGKWGYMIPWVIAADADFLEYDNDGKPSFAMNTEKNQKLLEKLIDIFYDPATIDLSGRGESTSSTPMTFFTNNQALFLCGFRIGSLDQTRNMTNKVGIIPYPKLDENQEKYVTSTHDTTNIGVIPVTCTKLDTVSAVIEMLSLISHDEVLPAYYESALKIKYAHDDVTSQMLDIIRDGLGSAVPLAFGDYCNDFMLKNTFSNLLLSRNTGFASMYTALVNPAQAKLDELWDAFNE